MSKIYLSQRDLFEEIIKCRIENRMSDKLGQMFMTLSKKYANHRNFVRYYHLHADMAAIGAAACCKGFYKFRPHKDKNIVWDEQTPIVYDHNIHNNAFAFFTTIIRHDFIAFLKKEYDQSNITNEMRLNNGLDASFGYTEMIAEKEKREQEKRPKSISFEDQSVWDEFESADEVDADDAVIDWNEVSS